MTSQSDINLMFSRLYPFDHIVIFPNLMEMYTFLVPFIPPLLNKVSEEQKNRRTAPISQLQNLEFENVMSCRI